MLPESLKASLGAIESFMRAPVDINGQDPSTMLKAQRRKPVPRRRPQNSSSEDEDQPRRKRKEKERQVYKSLAFIDDSDTDEEADRIFFEKEAALARANEERAKAGGHGMLKTGTKRKKGSAAVAPSQTLPNQRRRSSSTIHATDDEAPAAAGDNATSESEAESVTPTRKKTLRRQSTPTSE